jgi:hypothetical protein
MNEELDRLDRLLSQLDRVLEVPGEEGEASPEWTWQKLDRLEGGMGADALGALLRRQGLPRAAVDEALAVLARRRAARG